MDLYNNHFDALAADFIIMQHLSPELASNQVLGEMSKKLGSLSKRNSHFGLPEPVNTTTELFRINGLCNKLTCQKAYDETLPSLNQEQRSFVDKLHQKLNSGTGALLFLNGPAGRGKTYVCNLFLNYVRAQGQVALACASSAIAAMNYPGDGQLITFSRYP